jgi:hypothetical protein
MDMAEHFRGDRPIRFWFDHNDPYSAEFHSLNSCYLWGYTAVTYNFPSLDKASVAEGSVVVVPSSKPDVTTAATEAFAARGSSAKFLGRERDEYGGRGYWLNFFRIDPAHSTAAP